MGYAVVLGEALIDLLEEDRDGELIYRQAIGGAPLNVAVGVARLGGAVQYAGSLGKSGTPETWLFAPPDQPVMTQRR